MKIIPMRDLKDTVTIEKVCKETQEPIFVTKNGYGSLVVMDIDYYEQTMREIVEAKMILEGLEDVEKGNVVDGEKVLKDIMDKYSI